MHVLTDCLVSVNLLHNLLQRGRLTIPAGTYGSAQVVSVCTRINIASQRRPITVSWVRGHNGHQLNETIDRLAVQARRCVQTGGQLASIRALTDRIAADSCGFVPTP